MRRLGRWQMVDGVRVLMYGLGPFSLALHSGFAKLSAEIDGASDGPALASHRRPRRETAILYRLDIARGAEMLSLEWSGDGQLRIVSFERGAWEDELLSLRP